MSDISERVKKIVVEHLGVESDKVVDSASFVDDLGADSLDTVELVMAFEEEFNIEIPDEIAEKITTIKDAIAHIEKSQISFMRRVVVTGIGMCTPLGYGVELNWKRLINSESGIRVLKGFDIEDLSSKVGGQIPLEGNSDYFPENVINSKDKRKIEPFIELALIAAEEAIKDSGWETFK